MILVNIFFLSRNNKKNQIKGLYICFGRKKGDDTYAGSTLRRNLPPNIEKLFLILNILVYEQIRTNLECTFIDYCKAFEMS